MRAKRALARKELLALIAAAGVAAAWLCIAIARYTGGPLILVFDVDGKLLLRRRRILTSEDYPLFFRNGHWYIRRRSDVRSEHLKAPLWETTKIDTPYRTRTLEGWYYLLRPDGAILACKSDGLDCTEIRYVDGQWCIEIDGEWVSAFDLY